jgi:hypothetical protein
MALLDEYLMWVSELNDEGGTVWCEGHKIIYEEERSVEKFSIEFDIDWLKIMLADEFDGFMKVGRLFYYTHSINPGVEEFRIRLTDFPEPTKEEIELARKAAEEWEEFLKGD